jgi:hypothetical protein
MDLAIGLPNAVPGTTGEQLAEWARRAEAPSRASTYCFTVAASLAAEPAMKLAVSDAAGM